MSVVSGPRDGPVCAYPYVGENCSETIASKVYWNFYLPTQVGCLTLAAVVLFTTVRSFMAVGNKLKWNWQSFTLQMSLLVVMDPVIATLRAFDPLGWGGIMNGGVDAGLFMLKCSVGNGLVIGNIIRAMAKTIQSFCQVSSNTKYFLLASQAERMIRYTQWVKNISDVVLFLLISLEPRFTWIYYTMFVVITNVCVAMMLYYMASLGKFLTELMQKNLKCLSSSSPAFIDRTEEMKRLEDLIHQVFRSQAPYLIFAWIPAVWWIWTKANFSTNPPMVPRNFFDYFGRILFVWLSLVPGSLLMIFDKTLEMVSRKPQAEAGFSIWFVDEVLKCQLKSSRSASVDVTPVPNETVMSRSGADYKQKPQQDVDSV